MFSKMILASAAAAALVMAAAPAFAGPITANTGWQFDELAVAGGLTNGSPFTFSLLAGQTASFKVTDAFIPGDSFDLFSGITLLASSTAYSGAANAVVGDVDGESAWLSSGYEKLDYSFSGAGNYSFGVVGDGASSVPAGLYLRLDVSTAAVPEPGSLALAALALLGVGCTLRRRH